jgi:HPt (histidine-containing phosphotransfer) domain-containing protein
MTIGPAEAHLDTAALDVLREVGGDRFFGELIDTFLADAPSLLAQLRRGFENGRPEEARRAAHTLKSNGATFGAQSFSQLCRELEEMATTGRLERAPDLVGQVDAEYASVEAALAAVRDGTP